MHHQWFCWPPLLCWWPVSHGLRMVYHCCGLLVHPCWANAQLLWLAGHLKWAHGPLTIIFWLPLLDWWPIFSSLLGANWCTITAVCWPTLLGWCTTWHGLLATLTGWCATCQGLLATYSKPDAPFAVVDPWQMRGRQATYVVFPRGLSWIATDSLSLSELDWTSLDTG